MELNFWKKHGHHSAKDNALILRKNFIAQEYA